MYLNSFNHFRAIAIVLIVAGHSYKAIGMTPTSFSEGVIFNLIIGGTSLFVFISGFLFHHIFYKRYQYRSFISSKFKNIVIPYLILSLLPIAFNILLKKPTYNGYFLPMGVGLFDEYIVPSIKYLWTGRFLIAYWYIPFIFVTFLLSPLHIYFINTKLSKQLILILCLSVIAVFMHRPVDNINVIQSVLYFTPIYLIGITCSIHKTTIYEYLTGKDIYLLILTMSFAILQTATGKMANYVKAPLDFNGIDIMYFQKIAMCLFFMIFFHRFESYQHKLADTLAAMSFSIFFLHPYLLWYLNNRKISLHIDINWITYLAVVGIIITFCILLAETIKNRCPKYSRYIIGY